jgi:streptogramin lyase
MRRILAALALLAAAASPAAGAPGALVVGKAIPVGKHPAGVAVAAGSVWVTNDVDNTVSQVDPATGAVVRTVRLHGRDFPDPSVAVVGGGSVWVAAPTTGTISRIDPKTGALLATLSAPAAVDDVLVADGSLWVASFDPYRCSGNRCFSRLTRISTRTNLVTARLDVDTPTGLAAGDGSLWIVNHRAARVTRLDPRTGKAVAVIDVKLPHEGTFEGPEQVVAGLGGVWVTQPAEDVVTRIDPGTNRVAARIRLPHGSEPVTLAVGAGSIWAVGPKEVFRIDPATNSVTASARIGKHAGSDYRGLRRLAVDGDTVWVTDGDADTLDRIALRG